MIRKDFIIEEMDADALFKYANTLLDEMINDTEEFINEHKHTRNSTEDQKIT